MTPEERRRALVEFIKTARPVLCAWCGGRLNGGECSLCKPKPTPK